MSPLPNILPIRIYYEDTDFSGFVYHARYLHFFERGRTELLRAFGIHHRALHEGEGGPFGFVVRRMNVEYHAPAQMDDEVMVHTHLLAIKGARLTMHQEITRAAQCLTQAEVEIAFLAKGRASRFPPELCIKLRVHLP